MTFREKLKKAANLRYLTHTTRRLFAWHQCRRAHRQAIAEVDLQALEKLTHKWNAHTETLHPPKYLRHQEWLPKNIRRALDAGLLPPIPKQKILDLGCGPCWFIHVARTLGHEVVGMDVPGQPLYTEMAALLNFKPVMHLIRAFQPLPPKLQNYDLITAHMTCFNRHGKHRPWGPAEWSFFLDDLFSRLTGGGRILLELNPLSDGRPMPEGVHALFKSHGATIIGSRVTFVPFKAKEDRSPR